MKKLLLFLSCFITSLVMFAQGKVYTEQLVLTINGEISAPQDAGVVVVDNGNNTINFVLKNFFLVNGENTIPVGNISVENLPVKKGEDGLDYITFNGSIVIQPGDMEGIDMWVGPMVGEIPMKLQGKMNEDKLFVTIDIIMQESLGQIVYVQLGTDDFVDKEKEDAINGITTVRKSSSAIYDLNGRRIHAQSAILNSQSKKGLYIVGGKKVLF